MKTNSSLRLKDLESLFDSQTNKYLVALCGFEAYKELQKLGKKGIWLTAEHFTPPVQKGRSRIEKYITKTGNVLYINTDPYLDRIGKSWDFCLLSFLEDVRLENLPNIDMFGSIINELD